MWQSRVPFPLGANEAPSCWDYPAAGCCPGVGGTLPPRGTSPQPKPSLKGLVRSGGGGEACFCHVTLSLAYSWLYRHLTQAWLITGRLTGPIWVSRICPGSTKRGVERGGYWKGKVVQSGSWGGFFQLNTHQWENREESRMREASELSRYVEMKAGVERGQEWASHVTRELPCPGIKPVPPALEVQSLNHQGSPTGLCFVSMKWPLHRPHLVLLCFALLQFTDISFFFNWRFVATFCQASLLAQFFQQHLFTSCLCITFWQFLQYFKIFHYYSICYSGLGSLISDVIVIIVLGTTNCSQIEDKHSQCCVSSDCSTDWLFPFLLSLSLGLSIPWDTAIMKLGQLIMLW